MGQGSSFTNQPVDQDQRHVGGRKMKEITDNDLRLSFRGFADIVLRPTILACAATARKEAEIEAQKSGRTVSEILADRLNKSNRELAELMNDA